MKATFVSLVLVTTTALAAACSSSSGGNGNPGTGGAAGGARGGTGGSSGAGGTGMVQKLCATKTTLMNPMLVDFETYDGTVPADKYGTAFGGATPNTGTSYAGPFAFGDGSATPTMALLAGRPPGMWAVSES
ncbi:MAG: hypothetical protein ABI560_04585, partial [Myxococcales bacterium]